MEERKQGVVEALPIFKEGLRGGVLEGLVPAGWGYPRVSFTADPNTS